MFLNARAVRQHGGNFVLAPADLLHTVFCTRSLEDQTGPPELQVLAQGFCKMERDPQRLKLLHRETVDVVWANVVISDEFCSKLLEARYLAQDLPQLSNLFQQRSLAARRIRLLCSLPAELPGVRPRKGRQISWQQTTLYLLCASAACLPPPTRRPPPSATPWLGSLRAA